MARRRDFSRRDLFRAGASDFTLTGRDRLPRAVRLDDEREDIPRALHEPRAVAAVYPWASPRASRVFSVFPPAKPAVGRLSRMVRDPLRSLRMRVPSRVDFCVRRKIRKEVMFAIGVAGRRGIRRYRRSQSSQYTC